MRFQLWGNSRIHVRLFEPVDMGHQCRRAWDILGIDTDDGETIDVVGVHGGSRFLRKEHGLDTPVSEIRKTVDQQTSDQSSEPSENAPAEPEASAEDKGSDTPSVQTEVVRDDSASSILADHAKEVEAEPEIDDGTFAPRTEGMARRIGFV